MSDTTLIKVVEFKKPEDATLIDDKERVGQLDAAKVVSDIAKKTADQTVARMEIDTSSPFIPKIKIDRPFRSDSGKSEEPGLAKDLHPTFKAFDYSGNVLYKTAPYGEIGKQLGAFEAKATGGLFMLLGTAFFLGYKFGKK